MTFCSVIIPTIGRDTLTRAVESVFNQAFTAAGIEVIVVNDSGKPLPPAEWQASDQVRIITTNKRERCIARNSGAALAAGQYLCFLDDDDWLLPDALLHMWQLAQQQPDAAWLYGGIQIIDQDGRCLVEMNSGLSGNCFAQIMGGAWVPIQSSLIRSDAFFAAGGYNPFIYCTEDQDLCRRVALHGRFANTSPAVGCLFRGETWQTSSDYDRAPEDTRRSRDEMLAQPGAFKQLLTSADSAYWHGRVARVYFSTITYNLRRKRIMEAVSRGLFTLASVAAAGKHIFTSDFWQAVRADHVPNTLHFVMAEYEKQAKRPA